MRSDDFMTVPLCHDCHQHRPGALHRVGEPKFWGDTKPVELANALAICSGDEGAARAVVMSFRQRF
jgi:hypothetical protein